MIILHSEHDKVSRDFVSAYGQGHTILQYPDYLEQYPNISAFPSVVIEVPAYNVPEQIIPEEIIPEYVDEDGDTIPEEIIPEHVQASYNVSSKIELFRLPTDMNQVNLYQQEVNNRALSNPPIDGLEYMEF